MRRVCLRLAALPATFLFLALSLGIAAAQPMCRAPDGFPNPVLLETMRRGVNLPNWDHPDQTMRPRVEQLRALRAEGFTHIRLPVERPPLDDAAQQPFAEALFEQIVVLLSLDYTVSIDLHAGHLAEPYLLRGPAEAQAFLSAIWRRMAPAVRVFDTDKVAVELLNEPPTDQSTWRLVAAGLIADLRQWLPGHTIIVGPAGPQRHEDLAGMEPFGDRNVIYAVHYYDPFLFTHQGANWGGPNDPLQYLDGLPFPASLEDPAVQAAIGRLRRDGQNDIADEVTKSFAAPWTEDGIAQAFDMMAEWGERNGRPVIVNEFGTLTFTAPRASRLEWLAAVGRQARSRCIGWTHWDFQDGFGIMDPVTGMPDSEAVDALLGSDGHDH